MKTIDVLKGALRASPDRARTFIARAVEDDNVTEEECAELVAPGCGAGGYQERESAVSRRWAHEKE